MVFSKLRDSSVPPSPTVTVAEATAPSQPTAVTPAALECPPEEGAATMAVSMLGGSPTLEEVMELTPPTEDIHELLKLIEV